MNERFRLYSPSVEKNKKSSKNGLKPYGKDVPIRQPRTPVKKPYDNPLPSLKVQFKSNGPSGLSNSIVRNSNDASMRSFSTGKKIGESRVLNEKRLHPTIPKERP